MIYCNKIHCKYNRANDVKGGKRICVYSGDLELNDQCQCEKFERSMTWYFNRVWNEVIDSNMIPAMDMDEDLKIGMYYVMECYGLSFSNFKRGSWSWFSLVDPKTQESLTYKQIIERPFDDEKFKKLLEDFDKGILPGDGYRELNKDKKYKSQPYGILAPNGKFFEGEFGEHEQTAFSICEDRQWTQEFFNSNYKSSADFLVFEKNYVIIHNPTGDGGYIVTNNPHKRMTKKQKEFLYDYFYEMGDTLTAKEYLEED